MSNVFYDSYYEEAGGFHDATLTRVDLRVLANELEIVFAVPDYAENGKVLSYTECVYLFKGVKVFELNNPEPPYSGIDYCFPYKSIVSAFEIESYKPEMGTPYLLTGTYCWVMRWYAEEFVRSFGGKRPEK